MCSPPRLHDRAIVAFQTDAVEGAITVRFGSEAYICAAKRHVRFTPNSDRESRHLPWGMSALPPKADMCGAVVPCPLRAKSGHPQRKPDGVSLARNH
jgi:hypothetical protein